MMESSPSSETCTAITSFLRLSLRKIPTINENSCTH